MHPTGKEGAWLTTSRCCGRNSVSVTGGGMETVALFFPPFSFLFSIVSIYILQELRGSVVGDVLSTANSLSYVGKEWAGVG